MYLLVASPPPLKFPRRSSTTREELQFIHNQRKKFSSKSLPGFLIFFNPATSNEETLFSPLRVSGAGGGQPCFLNYLNRDKSSVVVRLSSSQKSALHAHALQATRLQQGIPRFLSSLCFSFSFFPLRASLLSVQAERAS